MRKPRGTAGNSYKPRRYRLTRPEASECRMTPASPTTLAVPRKPIYYSNTETLLGEPQLRERLQSQANYQVHAIQSVDDILLTDDGTAFEGRRYSTIALAQLCGSTTAGLTHIIRDFAQLPELVNDAEMTEVVWTHLIRPPRAKQRKSEEGMQAAIRIFNTAVQLRFEARLACKQFVLDPAAPVIEGISSHRYAFLRNQQFHEQAREVIDSRRAVPRFISATLLDGRLSLRYMDPDTLFEHTRQDGTTDAYHLGWYFQNSEYDIPTIKMGLLLIRESDDMMCMLNYWHVPSVSHMTPATLRRHWEERAEQLKLAERAARLPDRRAELQKQLTALDTTLLPMSSDSQFDWAALSAKLARSLCYNTKMWRILARDALHRTVTDTAAGLPRTTTISGVQYSGRSMLDVLTALSALAKERPQQQRDIAECVCYGMLTQQSGIEPVLAAIRETGTFSP